MKAVRGMTLRYQYFVRLFSLNVKKDCLWKQRKHERLENRSLVFYCDDS